MREILKPILIDIEEIDEEIDGILDKSGKNDTNRKVLSKIREAFLVGGEENEWRALSSWISTFYGYQQNWLLDPSVVSLSLKSRQSGGSLTYAAVAVLWGILGQKTAIISIGQREADRVLEYAKKHIDVLVGLGSKRAIPVRTNAERVVLKSNGSIASLPPSSGARGDSTNVILDEAAYYKNPPPDKVIDAAFAATTHGGLKIRILSTPNGVGNKFYLMCKGHKKLGYRLHKVTIHDAIEDGLPVDIKKCWSICLDDPRLFAQTYECSFLDSQFQYIPTEFIEGCCFDEMPQSRDDECFYGGLDIGRSNDLTVLLTIQRCGRIKDNKQAWAVRGLEKHRRTSEEGLNRLVADGFKKYKYKRLSLDATGIGTFPADAMVKKHGYSKVDPVEFTAPIKEELATSLYVVIANKRLYLPRNNSIGFSDQKDVRQLREDIASIQRIITENNNVKFDAPHSIEGHADRAWALALSVRAGLTAPTYARLPC